METLTLLQTGKRTPVPLLFIDAPGGSYWRSFFDLCKEHLSAAGYISASDFDLIYIVDRIDIAVASIDRFYYRYHSLRYVRNQLVLRLSKEIDANTIRELQTSFADILTPNGGIRLSGPLSAEIDEPEIGHLPRLVVDFLQGQIVPLQKW
jgi:hypothetical protein